ncbi:MAG: polyprenyl synthetase family protein [Bacteroidales bacterium]|nr:polyprenyl synthetase family protein [Bacteroidales bacterium]
MLKTDIPQWLGDDWKALEAALTASVGSNIPLLDSTNASLLSQGGKRIRPALMLLSARACAADGKTTQDSIRFAAAVEMLHNATLLHDDVADGSAERRGHPTVLKLLGPTASVLVGDFWLVRCMDAILASEERGNAVLRVFSKTLQDLAEGEMLQLQKASLGDTTEAEYMRIIYSKTASMFEAACVSGAMSVDAPEAAVDAVREYACCLGLAFQIRDDILDYDGGQSLGKPVGVDLKEQKITLPLLGALLQVDDARGREIRRMVGDIPDHPEYCDMIREFVLARGGIAYAEARADELARKAVEALAPLPWSKERDHLETLARFSADRKV